MQENYVTISACVQEVDVGRNRWRVAVSIEKNEKYKLKKIKKITGNSNTKLHINVSYFNLLLNFLLALNDLIYNLCAVYYINS